MSEFRADLAGAAIIIAVMKAVATMALPCNVTGEFTQCSHNLNVTACPGLQIPYGIPLIPSLTSCYLRF